MTTTVVLVHGGTLTSTMWDPVIERLATPAFAVDLPGRRYHPADLSKVTRADWVAAVVEDLSSRDLGPVVLAGHSSAGYVIPEVAAALPDRVAHLVFIAATVPADGTRPVEYLKPRLRDLAIDHVDLVLESTTGKTIGGLRPGEPPIETTLKVVENDPRMGLEAPLPLHEVYEGWAKVPATLPKTYIRLLQDRVVKPELTELMMPQLGDVQLREIDSGHLVHVEAPGELAGMLDGIAATVR